MAKQKDPPARTSSDGAPGVRPPSAKVGQKPPLERAAELARTGDYHSVWDIKNALRSENYSVTEVSQIAGSKVYGELTEFIRKAREAPKTDKSKKRRSDASGDDN